MGDGKARETERLGNLSHVTQLIEAGLRSHPDSGDPTTHLWLLPQICPRAGAGTVAQAHQGTFSFIPQLTFEGNLDPIDPGGTGWGLAGNRSHHSDHLSGVS